MESRRILFFACVLLNLVCVVANGGITYIDQGRYVSTSIDQGSRDTSATIGFGAFDVTASVSWVASQTSSQAQPQYSQPYYLAMADHRSSLTAEAVTAKGSVLDLLIFYFYHDFSESAQSHFSVIFEFDHSEKQLHFRLPSLVKATTILARKARWMKLRATAMDLMKTRGVWSR